MQTRFTAVLPLLATLSSSGVAHAQQYDGQGHPEYNGQRVFAAWNFEAGNGSSNVGDYVDEEDPNLRGWDFRINLPWTHFKPFIAAPSAQRMTLVGVVEATPAEAAQTMPLYMHANNSMWAFWVDQSGMMKARIIPSRRALDSGTPENVTAIGSGWIQVTPLDVTLDQSKPQIYVQGSGIGSTYIHIVARTTSGTLVHSVRTVDSTKITSWGAPFTTLASTVVSSPTVSRSVQSESTVVIAWPQPSGMVYARTFNQPTGTYGPVTTVLSGASPGNPSLRLVWDGKGLNLFYINSLGDLAFRRTLGAATFNYTGQVATGVSEYDLTVFGGRVHAVFNQVTPSPTTLFDVRYSTSTTPPEVGFTTFAPAKSIGLNSHWRPRMGHVGDALYVAAVRISTGKVEYARKDAVVVPFEYGSPGGGPTNRFLEVGTVLDPIDDKVALNLETLSFNNDIYLVRTSSGNPPAFINFSRAALKNFLRTRLGTTFTYAGREGAFELAYNPILSEPGGQFVVGDVTGGGSADLVRFDSSTGKVRVSTSTNAFQPSTVWLNNLFNNGKLLVGDIDGDHDADLMWAQTIGTALIVRPAKSSGSALVAQPLQTFGTPSSAAPQILLGDVTGDDLPDLVLAYELDGGGKVMVYVAQPGGTFTAGVQWRSAFAYPGWKLALADVDGNGRADLVAVVPGNFVDGTITQKSPVYVSLSSGSSFGSRSLFTSQYVKPGEGFALADMNFDGKADLLRLPLAGVSQQHKRPLYVAFSTGSAFSGQVVVASELAVAGDQLLVAPFQGFSKKTASKLPGDANLPMNDVVAIRNEGGLRVARRLNMMGSIPYPLGYPHERYRFFTEKALGVAMFPDYFWDYCTHPDHRSVLLGASGLGDADVTMSSVRPGGQQGHLLQEMGHTVFRTCIYNEELFSPDYIFGGTPGVDGFGASSKEGCQGTNRTPGSPTFLDCRDEEHYFLAYHTEYRANGGKLRACFNHPVYGLLIQQRYEWLRDNWYDGVEYYNQASPAGEAGFEQPGLACLPGLCPDAPTCAVQP